MKRPEPGRPAHGIRVEIHQGGRLLVALPLGPEPIEVTLRDARSGLPLGSLSARGPMVGHVDEQPLPRLTRTPSDDFTMPLPEQPRFAHTPVEEPTGDLDGAEPETEIAEAPAPPPDSRRPVPNLARDSRMPITDEKTSPALVRSPVLPAGADASRFQPHPATSPGSPDAGESTLSAHLESITDESTISGLLEESIGANAVPPAEVWTRNASEWRSAGRLFPGQRATARRGWVSLESDGQLVVQPGPELSGTATMVDGATVELKKGGARVRLPAGSSVILRGPGHGLYVRADPPLITF